MRKKLSLFFMPLMFISGCLCNTIANATIINNIVAFGDSLSDNGNLYQYTQETYPPSPPYFNGHFSNGEIWIENLANDYFPNNAKDHLYDYAFGGAGVATDDGAYFSLQTEMNTYFQSTGGKADENTLYVVWIGANNYFGMIEEENPKQHVEQTTTDVVLSIQQNLLLLSQRGAKKILILGLPDLGKTPAYLNYPEKGDILSEAATLHNSKLQTVVQKLQTDNPDTQWIFADSWQAFHEAITHPELYGFTNTTEACFESETTRNMTIPNAPMLNFTVQGNNKRSYENCDEFIFFDRVHPTKRVHSIIAKLTKDRLEEAGIEFQRS